MDVGKRPSRLRRHLPMSMAVSGGGSGSGGRGSGECESRQQDQAVSQSGFQNHPTASHALRRRKQRARLVSDRAEAQTAAQVQSSQGRSTVFRWLFWSSCGAWALFLVFRILLSVWRGEYTQLSVVHYVTKSMIQ